MISRYYCKALLRRTLGVFPIFLFSVSFALFLLVLVPSARIRLRNSTLLSTAPFTVQITGIVYEATPHQGGVEGHRLLAGVTVESGGFRTLTSPTGAYELKLVSHEQKEVPVIFSYQGHDYVTRISFALDGQAIRHDFAIPQ